MITGSTYSGLMISDYIVHVTVGVQIPLLDISTRLLRMPPILAWPSTKTVMVQFTKPISSVLGYGEHDYRPTEF